MYTLKGEPYMNIIVNEDGAWRPMRVPGCFPIGDLQGDFLDDAMARAEDSRAAP